MFKTRKIESGIVKVTHETGAGDIGVEITVFNSHVSGVELDLSKMNVEVLGGDDIYLYNQIVATVIPMLIEDGVL